MKTKIMLVLLIIICTLFISYVYFPKNKFPLPIENSVAKTIELPSSIISYLQNSLLYGNAFNENQKFVVYFSPTDSDYYPEIFLRTLHFIEEDKNFSQEYTFLPRTRYISLETTRELEEDKNFIQLCKQFCIINPKTNELFYINGISEQDARELPNIFEALRHW